jgi:DNA polymerase
MPFDLDPRERQPGATFAPGDICWVDFETRASVPIDTGSDRYSRHAEAILLAWAIGDGPVRVISVKDFGHPLRWVNMPSELHAAFARAEAAQLVFCAHNATFDRSIWNNATDGFPVMEPWMLIDTRVQAAASGLPASLEMAARYAGTAMRKDKTGKALIDLFTLPNSTATPLTHPDDWRDFTIYAANDIAAMRDLFKHTRQLPLAEWREYWAAERINDAGVGIDLPLVHAAANMAAIDQQRSAAELYALTGAAVETVNQVQRIIAWLARVLPAEGREMLVKQYEEVDEEGVLTRPEKRSLTRDRVLRLLAYLEAQQPLAEPLSVALRVLQIRMFGGSKTPAKFARMLKQHVDGVIRHQYVFNGATQTGRFSAKGVQVHNLLRDAFVHEIDAIDALVGGVNADNFAALGDDTPISRKLSFLIRPTFVAGPGNAFCWGDWANIEARLVPWLSADPEAEERLDIFRSVDAGIEPYDIYTRTAAELSGLSLGEVDGKVRQRGKVVELACGFGGSTNALMSMAASYGIHLDEEVAREFVGLWRERNGWAVRFWGRHDDHSSYGLWGGLNRAIETPGSVVQVGRVAYVYLGGYLGGSLLCRLPSGRYLTYRGIRWERVEEVDEDTGQITDVRYELMFGRDMGRVKLWPGLACENIVQATAADILRGTLLRLDEPELAWMPVRLHTHDEVLVEALEGEAAAAALMLRDVMQQGFTWSAGLPIAADTVIARWYSKHKGSLGL